MVRIGILLTYPDQERGKDDLMGYRKHDKKDCPYADEISPEWVLEPRRQEVTRRLKSKVGIPTDVGIACCIKHMFQKKDVSVDFIWPHDVSMARLNANDLNFLLIYDLLEAFHTDNSRDKKLYGVLKACLTKATNIYPPLDYQKLIYSKIAYYTYLKKHHVETLPTFTMSVKEYHKLGHEKAACKFLEHLEGANWGKFIGKPELGQEGKDIKFFEPSAVGVKPYLRRVMKKYPGVCFQKCIEGFGNTIASPELRMYHVGERYSYSACAYHGTRWREDGCLVTCCKVTAPTTEGGTLPAPMGRLRRATRTIMNKLPRIVMPNGVRLPRLITRLDMGYMIEGRFRPFVNEIEFVPSLYSEDVDKDLVNDYVRRVAKQAVKIARLYASGTPKKRKRRLAPSSSRPLGVRRGWAKRRVYSK